MKKALTALVICLLPLAVNAVNAGGFEFPSKLVTELSEDDYMVFKELHSDYWVGFYKKSRKQFHIFKAATAIGDNYIWEIDTVDKGEVMKKSKYGIVRSTVSLSEVDCINHRIKTLSVTPFIEYFGEGNSILELQWVIPSE